MAQLRIDPEIVRSDMTEDDWAALELPKPKQGYGPKNAITQKPQGKFIDVGDGHTIFAQEFGNPEGEPLIFLHGGPGAGGDDSRPRYYDQKRFRIIIFDQRGCGNSTPNLKQDYVRGTYKNNTATLVEDIEKVRAAFGVKGKAHITGGSWGSTLALAYAIKHPEHVKSLILSGIFLGTQGGKEFLFQGNAANYKECDEALRRKLDDTNKRLADVTKANTELEAEKARRATLSEAELKELPPLAVPRVLDSGTLSHNKEAAADLLKHFNTQKCKEEGAYRAYMGDGRQKYQIPPELRAQNPHMALAFAKAWDEFVRVIPKEERGDMVSAYCRILERDTKKLSPEEQAYQQRVAFAFAKWEGILAQFSYEPGQDGRIDLGKFEDPDFAVIFSRMEATFMRDGLYLTEDGSPAKPGSNYILENLHRIAEHKIPMLIVHGKRDMVCRPGDADELREAYEKLSGTNVDFSSSEATSHLQKEKGNAHAYLDIAKSESRIPKMTRAERLGEAQAPLDHAARKGGREKEG